MSCNRGEISICFARAGSELGFQTVAVYSKEDEHSLHRYKADQAFLIGKDKVHNNLRSSHIFQELINSESIFSSKASSRLLKSSYGGYFPHVDAITLLLSLLQSPIGAYLDYPDIFRVAEEIGCDAIHPGYGLLSENENFAKV